MRQTRLVKILIQAEKSRLEKAMQLLSLQLQADEPKNGNLTTDEHAASEPQPNLPDRINRRDTARQSRNLS